MLEFSFLTKNAQDKFLPFCLIKLLVLQLPISSKAVALTANSLLRMGENGQTSGIIQVLLKFYK